METAVYDIDYPSSTAETAAMIHIEHGIANRQLADWKLFAVLTIRNVYQMTAVVTVIKQ